MAHDLTKKWRSDDIKTEENSDFISLLLSKRIQDGLSKCGFLRPSPIQLQAIPLGRCGLDLIVQAKSGTGKTCVFTVIALEGLLADSTATQVLVLAPTREIAYQIKDVITSIGCFFPNLQCGVFIGGLSLTDDKNNLKNCQIAIGTPGRIKHLIELGALKTNSIRLLILDEADKLLDDSFQEGINWIYKQLPTNKQMLALSATYPEALANLLKDYMRNPFYIRLNADQPALIGIKQYYKITKFHQMQHVAFQSKVDELLSMLKEVHFSQCLIFSNSQVRAESLSETLIKNGWPATYISGAQDQTRRLSAMAQLKTFQCRILVSTDLTSRGIDAENVNLIINIDVPKDLETYLHRIGRAGRFGSQGLTVTLVSKGKDLNSLVEIASQGRLEIMKFPKKPQEDLWSYNPESPHLISNEIKSENIKKVVVDKPSTIIPNLPKPTTITLDETDFDWLSNEGDVAFPSFTELSEDFDLFISNYRERHVSVEMVEGLFDDEDVTFDEEIEIANRKREENLMNFLNESKTNFWMALSQNCDKRENLVDENESGVKIENESPKKLDGNDNLAKLGVESEEAKNLNHIVEAVAELYIEKGETKMANDSLRQISNFTGDSLAKNFSSEIGKESLYKIEANYKALLPNIDSPSKLTYDSPIKRDKIEPVPALIANMSESKRRMMTFYQSIQSQSPIPPKSENPPSISQSLIHLPSPNTETNELQSIINPSKVHSNENSSESEDETDESISEKRQESIEKPHSINKPLIQSLNVDADNSSDSEDNDEPKTSETLEEENKETNEISDSSSSEESDEDSLYSSLEEPSNQSAPLSYNSHNYQYLYPNMNSSIQRAATNYSNYMSHMMSWYKNYNSKPK